MKRTELQEFANIVYNANHRQQVSTRVYHCNAEIIDYSSFVPYSLLKSYNTIVGIYSKNTGTLYIFDYYSATTYQHIYKASKLLNADRITWLYKKSDNIIETGLNCFTNTFKLTSKQWETQYDNDFSDYIENKAFHEYYNILALNK